MVQSKVHRMRPEQRGRGRAPFLHPGLIPLRAQQVVLDLLGQIAVRRCVGLDPGKSCLCAGGLRETEHRRQEYPLAATVILVVEVAPDASAGRDERALDALDELGGPDEELRGVEPVVGAGDRLAPDLVRVEPLADAPECRRVHALALFPPVDARFRPVVVEPRSHQLRRVVPARRPTPAQRPEQQPEPVGLQLRPRGRVALAVERVARVPRAGRPREHDARAPVEEPVGALDLADLAHCVGGEAAVAQPRVAVHLEVRARDIGAGRRLPGEDHLDRAGAQVHRYLTEPASRPCTKYRWNEKNTTSGMIRDMKDAGAMMSMFGCVFRAITSATSRSFQVQRNWKIASEAIAGRPSGRISFQKMRNSDAPSMRADSRMSLGIPMKKLRSRKIANGSPNAVWKRISPSTVS